MKNPRRRSQLLLAGLLVFAVLSACHQTKPVEGPRPIVILISIDGFRSDYLEKYQPPNLLSLAKDGVRARWMVPSFPSKTFTNHYTIVTGLYPQNHGIVENSVYDQASKRYLTMSDRKEVQDGRWWLGEPIWVTAEKQGQKAAPMFWPGSEAEIGGIRPSYWKPYDGKVSNAARVDAILSWLDLPPDERPTFMTLYFNDVDEAGHDFSPDSIQTRDAVLNVDADLTRLIDGLKSRELFEQVNLIVVSDHGMATQDPKNFIMLDGLFDTSLAEEILWTAEIVGIFPAEGKEAAIYDTLKAKLPSHAKIYRKSELPARFHYSDSPRIAPLLVLPDEGWTLMSRKRLDEKKAKGQMSGLRGGHGYDNELASMRAIFIAHGSAFRKGVVIEPFSNIQVYNVMCKVLGLTPASNDGDFSVVNSAVVDHTR